MGEKSAMRPFAKLAIVYFVSVVDYALVNKDQ